MIVAAMKGKTRNTTVSEQFQNSMQIVEAEKKTNTQDTYK